jgi:carboxymethylenebutenolidase
MDRTFYAAPENVHEATPTLVLAMHLWGVDSNMRDVAQRFAKAGFATLVPDLYARYEAPDGDGATDHTLFVPLARSLTAQTVEPDIRSAALSLRERFPKTKTAIAGFCMGGVIALRRSAGHSDLFTAGAVWYGAIPTDLDPAHVDIPLVASYGALDAGIPVQSVEEFAAGLRVPNDVKIYSGAGHAFCDDRRAAYEPDAAQDSWTRSITFLRRALDVAQ